MTSICVYIFDMPKTIWMDHEFDYLLIFVHRGCGWMFARPTTKLGLTGEKRAHLRLDSSWAELKSHPSLLPIKVASLLVGFGAHWGKAGFFTG